MAWDPAQYLKFRDARMQPFADLVALAKWPEPSRRKSVVDLGCGTGELTARLGEILPNADVLGIDNSESMLAEAQKHAGPSLRFSLGSIEKFAPESPVDVLFSHAALQWVDNHRSLFKRLAGSLLPGGILLVQMPSNHDHISHAIVREVATSAPFYDRLGGFVRRSPVLPIDAYAEHLHAIGLFYPIVIEKVYGHIMPDAQGVLEWVRGTLLVPYLERLKFAHAQEFLAEISRRYTAAMPEAPYYYPFKRTLIAAVKPA